MMRGDLGTLHVSGRSELEQGSLCECRPHLFHPQSKVILMNEQAKPPLPEQSQPMPGRTDSMDPKPDHGEESYRGSGKLSGKRAVITGGDSGIGRAVALAF